ncbi:MAG: hypothetical protein IPH09_11930, partial [bacterium]|nr:hypothetical protein [bacterium]
MSEEIKGRIQVDQKTFDLLRDVVRPGQTTRGEFIPGVEALDPRDKRSTAFLGDKSPNRKLARNVLRQRLRLLEELLSKAMESGDVLAQIQEPILETQVSFKRNLDKVYEKTWDLEQTYRTLGEMMRSASAGISQELELYLLNMATEDLVKSQALSGQLRHFVLDRADALKKDEAFTAIIAPGGATCPESVEILGKLAERAGLVLFTDIPDLANLDKIKEFLSVDLGNPSGDKPYLNHVALFANYPRIAHARDGELGDEFGMYLPPTAFVVGRYYNNAVSGNLVDSIAGLKDNFKNATGTRVFINQTKSAD